MIAYRHELRAVYDRLDLPQPLRARVLLELATDLAGLEAELLSAGLPPDEARARAVRTLVPSAEALHELREIHRPRHFISIVPHRPASTRRSGRVLSAIGCRRTRGYSFPESHGHTRRVRSRSPPVAHAEAGTWPPKGAHQVCSTPTRKGCSSGWWAAASRLRVTTSRVARGSMISSTQSRAAA